MNIILLAGGRGERLWPLSNNVCPKQFVKIFPTNCGEYKSMLQRICRQILEIYSQATITIVVLESQVSLVQEQIDDNNINISIVPYDKGTFPSIVLSSLYLHDVLGVKKNEAIIICPVDQLVDAEYFKALEALANHAAITDANISLMGVEPTYPSNQYGYIIPNNSNDISKVSMFKEKPDEITAIQYVSQGALWNAGVFAFRMDYILKYAHELIEFKDYYDLLSKYGDLIDGSFDHNVIEQEINIDVMRFNGIIVLRRGMRY